ncbi:RecX family transcriptional regulator [bacterium endosymbiont of Escarpia laminata]|nr:MAG: RecX family transcriptional regulator [bacterium endosymbiont of Escarpia laminata]
MYGRGFDSDDVEAVLDDLERTGLLSDARFTESYIEWRVGRGSGPVRIRRELRERGIDNAMIANFLEIYSGEWWELLKSVRDRKYGSELSQDRKELSRRARFLEYRGFPGELIRQFLFDFE